MSEASISSRMAELDAVLTACSFPDATVRDSSNRSNRDWPWWSVDVVQRREDFPDTRRATAIVRLNATRDALPGDYDGAGGARYGAGAIPTAWIATAAGRCPGATCRRPRSCRR